MGLYYRAHIGTLILKCPEYRGQPLQAIKSLYVSRAEFLCRLETNRILVCSSVTHLRGIDASLQLDDVLVVNEILTIWKLASAGGGGGGGHNVESGITAA